MPPEISTTEPLPKRAPTLYLIASIKLAKGLVLLLVALGIFALVGQDLQDYFERLVRWFSLDPEHRFFVSIGDQLDKITPANVRRVGIGTGLYSLISLVESVGLMFRVSWAGWLAIGDAAFFIPIELHELTIHLHWFVLAVLAFNVLIVWYLFANRHRLFRHHH